MIIKTDLINSILLNIFCILSNTCYILLVSYTSKFSSSLLFELHNLMYNDLLNVVEEIDMRDKLRSFLKKNDLKKRTDIGYKISLLQYSNTL